MQISNFKFQMRFREFKYEKNEIIQKYFDKLMVMSNKIRLSGENLFDNRIANKIFISLSKRFVIKIYIPHKINYCVDSIVTLASHIKILRSNYLSV